VSAPPLVLLHGLGTGPSGWQPQVEALSPSRTVLTPTLRLDSDFDFGSEASRIFEGIDEEKIDLCGLSLGALIALRAALDVPDRVRRLALSAGFASLPRSLALLQLALGNATRLMPAGVLRNQLCAGVTEPHRETAKLETAQLDGRAIRHLFREGRRFDVSARLERLTMPVLVIVGANDWANRRLSRRLADQLPSAELEVIPGASHVANLDAPDAFSEALRRFLDPA
jgi:3-oxoadipate enol-lactonase